MRCHGARTQRQFVVPAGSDNGEEQLGRFSYVQWSYS
jgi:hypothetical protein